MFQGRYGTHSHNSIGIPLNRRIQVISPRRFRTTVLTDLYDTTKDIKQAQTAAGHTTAAMTLKHYIKGRHQHTNTATPIASVYGLKTDEKTDFGNAQFSYMT